MATEAEKKPEGEAAPAESPAPVIIINEAIEVAKKFGAEKSGGFVNGILDRIKKELNRPDRVGIAKTES